MSKPTSTEAFSQLAAEMDLADYERSNAGTRKTRHEKLTQNNKRPALDMSDDHAPTEDKEKSRKRIRGSRVAFEDTVLNDMPMIDDDADDADSDEDDEAYVPSSEDEAGDVDDEAGRFPAGEPSTSTAIQLKPGSRKNKRSREKNHPKLSGTGLRKIDTSKTNNQRAILRMRDFASKKLAKQHSEALGAHISGMSETAVLKLRDVAESAPGAHQVYSSLGMVFDGMILSTESEELVQMSPRQIRRRLVLAKKAFSSYNVAAALCKRDCVLWEKAGDAAVRVADLYSEILDVSEKSPDPFSGDDDKSSNSKREFDPASGPERWREDRDSWFEKALSAYQSADSLKPPGIDIPCKLAKAHIRNGDYIDALSIFTDLRLKASGERSRSSMEGSFPCWLLYAELMLRIGFQCEQWNAQESKIDKNTFKRWLRKHSKTFDWKGRRIQALCLALEAAAGTVSCAKLVEWMRNHANQESNSKGNDLAVDDGETKDDAGDHESPETALDKSCHTSRRDSQKKLNDTVAKNNLELEQFDVTSKRMKLVEGSIAYNNRQSARSAIIEKHRTAMRELVRQIAADESLRSHVKNCNGEDNPLPLYGTYETVLDISLMLLRECVQLQLFDCGLLVVESFVNYSSERLQRHDRKMRRKQECEAAAANGGDSFSYDKIGSDSSDDDEPLEDDDDDLAEAWRSISRGDLPFDMKLLNVVCLLGSGTYYYVAINLLEQVMSLSDVSLFAPTAHGGFSGATDDGSAWRKFSQRALEISLTKSYLLSSAVDALVKKRNDLSWTGRALRLIKSHLKAVDGKYGLETILAESTEVNREQTLKIMFAMMNLLLHCARLRLPQIDDLDAQDIKAMETAVSEVITVIKFIIRVKSIIWLPDYADWSLPQSAANTLGILSEALSILVEVSSIAKYEPIAGHAAGESLQAGLAGARNVIATVCQTGRSPSSSTALEGHGPNSWQTFPLPNKWQDALHISMSVRTYNLCTACCVSSFSGWNPHEFCLDQLKAIESISFFGVTMDNPTLSGFLPPFLESEVSEQWDLLGSILPEMEALDFDKELDKRKSTEWYKRVQQSMNKEGLSTTDIALQSEDKGLRSLLSFSWLCLLAAEQTEGDDQDGFVKLAMSILLPATQFCIDKHIWHSQIGKKVINLKHSSTLDFLVDSSSHRCIGLTLNKDPPQKKRTQQPSRRETNDPQVSFQPRPPRGRPVAQAFKVPTSLMLREWRKEALDLPGNDAQANRVMRSLDNAIMTLKQSRSLNALQVASIDVASSLLEVASRPECNNPFVCLQQAAIYANLGSKRGNNDEKFKGYLTSKDRCTPTDALVVLGRADCLRAIHFIHEAQYLCSWVASICATHRNTDRPWSRRWRVVGILVYVVATTIEETAPSAARRSPSLELKQWDRPVMEEIRLAKLDAVALVRDSFSNPKAEENESDDLDSVTPPLPAIDGNHSDGANDDRGNVVGV